MRRRKFIMLLGGAAAWPVAVRGQQGDRARPQAQQVTPVVGFLGTVSPRPIERAITAFQVGLKEAGYVDGQNITIEYRWAEGRNHRLPELALDLIKHNPSVLVTTGGGASALAAKAATTNIPIVFSAATDPVQLGLVDSLNRPGGNATGVFILTNSLEGKRLVLLHEMVPSATIAALVNPLAPGADTQLSELRSATRNLLPRTIVLKASSEQDLEIAFTTLRQEGAEALLVAADPFFNSRREQLIELAARHAVPAIYEFREFAEAGGLMSYGTSLSDAYRQLGLYTGRILNGERPADLPVMQPTKFEFVVNLKTARTLGLRVPQTLLVAADEVIE